MLFDLDSSLHDSERVASEANARAFRRVVRREMQAEERRGLIGKPVGQVLEGWFPGRGQDLFRAILEEYEALSHYVRAYDEVSRMLQAVREYGYALGVVTTKLKSIAHSELRHTGLADYFDVIVAQEDTPRHKPGPQPLLHAAALLHVSPVTCLYAGDQPGDIMAARAADMESAGIVWGDGEHVALMAAQPDLLFETPQDLVAAAGRARTL